MTELKKKVLIVEDDVAFRNVLSENLTNLGITVEGAEKAQQALSMVKAAPPDLIILDIMLPGGMNGFDFMEQVKRDPKIKDIPVIVLTNLSSEEKTASQIGAVAYEVKSNISIDDFILKVKKYLG